MTNLIDVADAYLNSWSRKDPDGIAATLHPDVTFKGPVAGEISGREAVVAGFARMLPLVQALHVRAKFSDGHQVMCAEDFVCREPIGSVRTAELLTFEDGLIRSIELFFDARPFEAAARAQSTAA